METIDPKDSVQNEQFSPKEDTAENTDVTSSSHVDENETKNDNVVKEENTVNEESQKENIPEKMDEEEHIIEETEIEIIGDDNENDDDDDNFDPHNIEEEHDDSASDDEIPDEDYTKYSKQELIHKLSVLISTKPIEKIRLSVESIKNNFYKKHKAEIEKLRKESEETGAEEDLTITAEPEPLEDSLKDLPED